MIGQTQPTRTILLGGISMANETLLVVDDNEALREGLSEMLSFEGFTVITAGTGVEALEKMQVVTPDLIISDITMPQMDGYSYFNAVRSQPEWVTIPFIFLTARAEREDILAGKNMGAEDYLVKPLSREELVTAVRSRLARSRQLEMAQLQQAYEASLTALANAIDLRDRYTRGHVERVTAYAMAIARCMEWPEWRIEQLRFGAILHDIGKIHIRETTLFKVTPLTDEEWAEIKRHPVNGAEMIKDIPYLTHAVPIVRHHHERWDGNGYPDRIAGEAIPIEARIVAIADAFDAMTTERPYSARRDLEEAYDEILKCSGEQFDPKVVKAFEAAWASEELHKIKATWK
jgi:putative two-component system response regulator